MTNYTQFHNSGGLKTRSVFSGVKKPGRVVTRDAAFKVVKNVMSPTLTELPHHMTLFNGVYVAVGTRMTTTTPIYTTTDIVNGVWTRQVLTSTQDNLAQSDTELFLYNSSVASTTATAQSHSANGATFTAGAFGSIPGDRVYFHANGLWVALGAGTTGANSIYTSTDNRTYTARTLPQILGSGMNRSGSMIYFAGAHRIFFDQTKQFYSTDNGVNWTYSDAKSTSLIVSYSSNLVTRQQQLAVIGNRLYRFFNVATATVRGYLACEYTLDGTTWTGFQNLSTLRPDLVIDTELITSLQAGACTLSVVVNAGAPRTANKLGVQINGSTYIPIRSFRLDTNYYNGTSRVYPIKCGIHVLQIRPDFSMEIHDVVVTTTLGNAMVSQNGWYLTGNYAGIHLLKGVNDELIICPHVPPSATSAVITQPYVANFEAQETVLEYE